MRFHTFRKRHACPSSFAATASTSSGSLPCLGLGAIRNNGGSSRARKGQACHARTTGIGEKSGFLLGMGSFNNQFPTRNDVGRETQTQHGAPDGVAAWVGYPTSVLCRVGAVSGFCALRLRARSTTSHIKNLDLFVAGARIAKTKISNPQILLTVSAAANGGGQQGLIVPPNPPQKTWGSGLTGTYFRTLSKSRGTYSNVYKGSHGTHGHTHTRTHACTRSYTHGHERLQDSRGDCGT